MATTARGTVETEWLLKLEGYKKAYQEISQLPAKQADIALKALDRQVKADEKAFKAKIAQAAAAEKAQVQAAREAERASVKAAQQQVQAAKRVERAQVQASNRAGEAFEAATQIASAFGGTIGDVADVAEYMGKGLSKLGGPAGVATAALAAVGYAWAQMTRAAIEFLDGAVETLDELEEMGRAATLPAEAVARLREWEEAAAAVRGEAKSLRVELASYLAPTMTHLADVVLGARDALEELRGQALPEDTWQQMAGQINIAETALRAFGLRGEAIIWVLDQIADHGEEVRQEAQRAAAEWQGPIIDEIELRARLARERQQQEAQARREAEARAAAAEATRQYNEALRENVEIRRLERQLQQGAIAATDKLRDGLDALAAADMTRAEQARARHEERIEFMREQLRAGADATLMAEYQAASEAALQRELTAILEEEAQARDAIRQREAQDAIDAQMQILRVGADTFGALSQAAKQYADTFAGSREDMTESEKKAARTAFEISRATALAQVAIQGAVAIARTLAELGPIAGPIAAVGVGATVLAQTAAIGAQQPPEFPAGGIVRPSPDHQLIAAQPGEGVVSRRGMAALGEEGLHAINRGEPPVQRVEVVMQYRHRIFDRFIRDNLQRPGPLAGAISGGRRIGHTSR